MSERLGIRETLAWTIAAIAVSIGAGLVVFVLQAMLTRILLNDERIRAIEASHVHRNIPVTHPHSHPHPRLDPRQ